MRNIPYGRQSIDQDAIDEVSKILKSDWLTQGPMIRGFEESLCRYTGARYAVAVSSGTAALHISCLAAGIKGGDEVITSAITFAASANCALYCGARPAFADISPDHIDIDPEEIERSVTGKTKAVIPVHFAGHPCRMDAIRKIAKKRGLIIIEDAAHALGAEYNGSKVGSCKYSDMTIFSFHPVKSITTGEGGAVLTNSKYLYDRLLLMRNHGITKDASKLHKHDGPWFHEMQELGFNYRITDFQSILGISQLKKLDKFIKARRKIAHQYNNELSEIDAIDLPSEDLNVKSAWHLYCIRIKGNKPDAVRKKVFCALRDNGIGAQVHYIPVYKHPYYKKIGYGDVVCANAESFYRRAISIPIYPAMTEKDSGYVIDTLSKIFSKVN